MAIEHTFNSAGVRNLMAPLRVYFAGKVRRGFDDYRARLFQHSRIMSIDVGTELPIHHELFQDTKIGTVKYGGPSALSCDHGCWHSTNHGITKDDPFDIDCTFPDGSSIHAGREALDVIQQYGSCGSHSAGLSKAQALERCMYQIKMCDALYAYIDAPDCYGTLCEIGYAYALGIPIYIVLSGAISNTYDEWETVQNPVVPHDSWQTRSCRNDYWFAAQMATKAAWGTPYELLEYIAFDKGSIFSGQKIKRMAIRPKDRVAVLVRDGYTCQMCGISRRDGAVLEIDHIHPVSKGGANDLANLQVLCRECNAGKSNLILPMP